MTSERNPGRVELAEVEEVVLAALRSGDASRLCLLGHGEISMVLGWPADEPVAALKRLPPFATRAGAESYVAGCERFAQRMAATGVSLLPTSIEVLPRADGRFVVYHRQPVVDAATIGHQVLAAAPPSPTHPLLDAIASGAVAFIGPGFGLDCQASNWVWDAPSATAIQLDVTSPLSLDAAGTDLDYDTSCFLQEYPWPVRRYVKRELITVVRRFATAEGALTDLVANLIKAGLTDWVDPAVSAASRAGVTVDRSRAEAIYAEDRRLFPLTLRLKRAQRRWQRLTGRTYESILPERTTYR